MELLFPTSYAELKLHQYQRAARVIAENRHLTDPTEALLFNCEILSIVTNQPEDLFLNMAFTEYEKLLPRLEFLKHPVKVPGSNRFTFDGKAYQIITKPNDLTAGDFIDLCEFQKDMDGNLHYILAVLARCGEHSPDSVIANAAMFQEHIGTDIAMCGLQAFAGIMHSIKSSYKNLFSVDEEDHDTAPDWYTTKYGWMLWADKIAKGDAFKRDEILEKWGLYRFLNEVVFELDREKKEKQLKQKHGSGN